MHYTQEYWNDVRKVVSNIPNIEKIFNKRVLITGSTGMVCSSVVDLLAYLNKEARAGIQLVLAGRAEARVVERFNGVLDKTQYTFLEYNANDLKTIEDRADLIIHGASNANPAVYAMEPAETLLGNIIGLKNVLEMAKNNSECRLLYVSSSEVYGNRTGGSSEPYHEEEYGFVDILNPRACYPNGKRAAETLCAAYHQEYGVDFVVVRLGHIYGPSITPADTRASAAFTRDAAAGTDIVMKSAGAQLRSYCYTLDCASAILTVLLNGASANAYNISNKNSIVSIREIAQALAEEGGVKLVFENPTDAEKKSYNLMSNSALSSDKIEGLGWKALFDLKEGTRRTLQFYR